MALFHTQYINAHTRLGIWHIQEQEEFFLQKVPLQKGISHPHKRLQHLAGRYLLKELFSDFPYNEIVIADTRKPFLASEKYHFSISHCGNYAAAIVSSKSRVGIDIEIPTTKLLKVSKKFLHAEELTTFFNGVQPQNNFTDIEKLCIAWSAKEAVFKWWSYGQVDFKQQIRLFDFIHAKEGSFKGAFLKEKESMHFLLHYRLFENLCLVWMMD